MPPGSEDCGAADSRWIQTPSAQYAIISLTGARSICIRPNCSIPSRNVALAPKAMHGGDASEAYAAHRSAPVRSASLQLRIIAARSEENSKRSRSNSSRPGAHGQDSCGTEPLSVVQLAGRDECAEEQTDFVALTQRHHHLVPGSRDGFSGPLQIDDSEDDRRVAEFDRPVIRVLAVGTHLMPADAR